MSEYQKPYLILWKAISEALAEMKEQNYGLARSLLLKAQVAAEEAYISQPEDEKNRACADLHGRGCYCEITERSLRCQRELRKRQHC